MARKKSSRVRGGTRASEASSSAAVTPPGSEDGRSSPVESSNLAPSSSSGVRGERRIRRGDGDSRVKSTRSEAKPTKKSPSDESKIGGEALKEKGNAYFKRGDFEKAMLAYTEALTVCEPRNAELLRLRRQVLCNRSAAALGAARRLPADADLDRAVSLAASAYDDADAVLAASPRGGGDAAEDLSAKAVLRKAEACVAFWRARLGHRDLFVHGAPRLDAYDLEAKRDRSSPVANASLVDLRRELCTALRDAWPPAQRRRAAHLLVAIGPPKPHDADDAYRAAGDLLKAKDGLDIAPADPNEKDPPGDPGRRDGGGDDDDDDDDDDPPGDSSTAALPDDDDDDDDDRATVCCTQDDDSQL